LKANYDDPLSNFASNFNLRHYVVLLQKKTNSASVVKLPTK